jgi:hypothetical protein
MTLVDLHVDVGRAADALEKIVYLLEKLVFPPPPADLQVQQATLDDLHIVTPEDHQRIQDEWMAFAERYCVVPGSEAFFRELAGWEQEQRILHGQEWQAPDWAAAFAAAAKSGGGPVRESAGEAPAPSAGRGR